MLNVKTKNGMVKIEKIEGEKEEIVADVGSIAYKIMFSLVNKESSSKEDIYSKYETLATQLINYIETTIKYTNRICK